MFAETIRRSPIVLIWVLLLAVPSRAGTVAPDVRERAAALRPDEEIPVIVALSGRVDPALFRQTGTETKGTRRERRGKLIRALKEKAESAQGPVVAFLKARGAGKIRPLWINNSVAAAVPAGAVAALAGLPGVESVRFDGTISAPRAAPAAAAAPEWNIAAIRAPEVWELGQTGTGVVVASMDTGVDALHPDLAGRWRGGTNSWFDPNGEHPAAPYDATGHGTSVMGVILGGDAGGTAIGVAPGARWIAVKIFNDAGVAAFSVIHAGYQWLLDPDGSRETDDAPDVVNNSWGFDQNAGQCVPGLEADIHLLRVSGIAASYSAGNGGPLASTSVSPANYPEAFAVGAVDALRNVALFSGRGPAACDLRVYPEVVAPGVNVRTADLTFGGVFPNSYTFISGSSFAAAHVSGTMALLRGAFPGATVPQLESALEDTAVDLGQAGPDNDSGHGLVDARAAYDRVADSRGGGGGGCAVAGRGNRRSGSAGAFESLLVVAAWLALRAGIRRAKGRGGARRIV